MTVFRILPNGARRRLPGGSVRALGANGPRYYDVVGATSLGVAAGGAAQPLVPLVGQSWLSFTLAGSLTPAGTIGHATLSFGMVGVLSGVVSLSGAAVLGFNSLASLTPTRSIHGATAVQFAAGGQLSRSRSISGRSSVGLDALGQMSASIALRGRFRVGIRISGDLTAKAGQKWRELWLAVYEKRQALLNAIDANNLELAKQAGVLAGANASAIVQTNTRVDLVDGRVTTEAQRVTVLTGRVGNVEGTQTAQGTAISNLQTTQTSQGTTLTSHSQQLVSVQSSITTLDGKVTVNANATTALDARVSVNEQGIAQAQATWGVYLTAGNVISGVQSINNGIIAEFNVMAHVFRVMSPAGSATGLEWQNGYLRSWGGSAMAVIGSGFGTDNLMLFLGPNVGATAAKKSNAAMWADNAGNAGFSGSITSSVLSSSAIALASARIFCGGNRTAPFVIKDVARSSGGLGNKTATTRRLIAPDNGSGYDYSRMSEKVKDVYLTIMSVSGGGSGNETYSIEVQIDGGAWAVLGSETVGVISTVTHVFTYTYTTPANWSTLAFRARTTQGHTYHLVLNIEVQNFNTTGSAPGTFSDNSIAPPPPPPPAGGGGGSYCVDYETARLPDGRWVRDLQLGDEIGCWNDDPNAPAVTMQAVRALALGEEECFELVAASGARVIQS
ncbi:MAG: hypothetical protein ACN6OU_02135, partial [Stenotrophomonas acidaminiphila]